MPICELGTEEQKKKYLPKMATGELMGAFALTDREVSLAIIAALLTIVGYSLNDTIVVYDRIRENVARLRDRKFSLVVNASINDTVSAIQTTTGSTLIQSPI